jgi:hypothetical protein
MKEPQRKAIRLANMSAGLGFLIALLIFAPSSGHFNAPLWVWIVEGIICCWTAVCVCVACMKPELL